MQLCKRRGLLWADYAQKREKVNNLRQKPHLFNGFSAAKALRTANDPKKSELKREIKIGNQFLEVPICDF